MTITKLKAKNQVTIPSAVIKRLGVKPNGFFAIEVHNNIIQLTPVDIEPSYTPQELFSMDQIVEREKTKGKTFKSGKEFSAYLKKLGK